MHFSWIFAGMILSQAGFTEEESIPAQPARPVAEAFGVEKQITHGPGGRILTNTGVWSPDGQWLVYDTRSDAAGQEFDGETIEAVNVRTGEVRVLYRTRNSAHCGVATFHPHEDKVVFILGPENPTPDWQYGFYHRQGVIVAADLGALPTKSGPAVSHRAEPAGSPREMKKQGGSGESADLLISRGKDASAPRNLDACDLTPPFTPGALRGGSHVHVWDAAGQWVSFTYEDHVLAQFREATAENDINLRNVGVSIPLRPVHVNKDHPRNHDGQYFSFLATRTIANAKPGSDEIKKAFEEGWVGTNGYVRPDGSRQRHALAFQGQVVTERGETNAEVFIVDIPDDPTQPGDGPLAGTERRMPCPPRGCVQRRLTFTSQRTFPGIQGPRHWLRSSPDGSRIAFLMKDDAGAVQIWTVSPNGGPPAQLTHNPWNIASTFTWSPEGKRLAYVMDNSVCVTEAASGATRRLTRHTEDASAPRPEACVFSPDGKQVAFLRRVAQQGQSCNQIFVVQVM